MTEGKLYRLTLQQREEYRAKYFKVAPEVIEGEHRQSISVTCLQLVGFFTKYVMY